MLPEEENKLLMETGPGTLMGEFLRRYWMPIAAVAELDDMPIKPVRLMCEDLVLYRDKSGSDRMVKALTVRIIVAITIFVILMGSYYFGLISPQGL